MQNYYNNLHVHGYILVHNAIKKGKREVFKYMSESFIEKYSNTTYGVLTMNYHYCYHACKF